VDPVPDPLLLRKSGSAEIRLHTSVSHKMALFITTAGRTSNPTFLSYLAVTEILDLILKTLGFPDPCLPFVLILIRNA
jgi:hypothetical protein